MRRRLALIAALVAATSTASAHDFYSWECCSDIDCAPYDGAIRETPTGYLIVESDETISYATARVSPDGRNHRCVVAGKTKCLYVPLKGY